MNTYDELLQALKEARETEEKARSNLKMIMDSVKTSDPYTLSQDVLTVATSAVESLETKLREIAYTEWINTKNKHPHEKIEVKIFKTFKVLNADTLREWVLKNLPAALSPDLRKVEKYALEIGDVDGTEKGEEARIQIASKI